MESAADISPCSHCHGTGEHHLFTHDDFPGDTSYPCAWCSGDGYLSHDRALWLDARNTHRDWIFGVVVGGISLAVLLALGVTFKTSSLSGLWLAPSLGTVAITSAVYAHHTWKRRHPEPDRLEPRVLARQRFERMRSLEAGLTD